MFGCLNAVDPAASDSSPEKKAVSKKRDFKTSINSPGFEVRSDLKNSPTLINGKIRLRTREIAGGKG